MTQELSSAVQQAMTIIGWNEHLSSEEMPKEWMWHLDHELKLWFENVERKRKEKYGISDDEDEIQGPVMDNEFAQGMRG